MFKVEGRDISIVQRVLNLHEKEDGTVIFLTERDNNLVDKENCDMFAINVILKKNMLRFSEKKSYVLKNILFIAGLSKTK